MVQSLARGIEILSVIQERGSVTIVEVASVLGVDKSTISRLVATLIYYDMVSTDPVSKKCRSGLRNPYLSEGVKKDFNMTIVARPYLYKICNDTRESIHLAAMGNRKICIMDQVRSQRKYDLSAQIGVIEARHHPVMGRCVLACRPPSFTEDIFRNYDFKHHTPNTITTYQNLGKELEKIREQGYALDDERRTLGVKCPAVSIFNYSGSVSCCIGISAPKE